jgi:integrase
MKLNEYINQKKFKPLEQISRLDIESYIQDYETRVSQMDETKIQQKYVRTIATSIRLFLDWLTNDKEIFEAKEFCKLEKWLKLIKRGNEEDDRVALSKEDEKKVFRGLTDPLWRMIAWTGRNFGLRRIEYCGLKLRNLELDRKELDKDVPTIKIENSKGRKDRRIPLHPQQVIQWKTWLRYRSSLNLAHDFVFYNPKKSWIGMTKYVLSWLFCKFSKLLNVKLYAHRLRYTYAVRLWEGKVDIYTISRALGHSRLETTIRYLKVQDREFFKKFLDSTRNCF